MRDSFLFVHSWMRWIVLLSTLFLTIRFVMNWRKGIIWSGRDSFFSWAFEQALGYQILFGLTLLLANNPLVVTVVRNGMSALSDPMLLFFTLIHPVAMILAMVIFQVGKNKTKSASIEKRQRLMAFTFIATTLLILAAIPWPIFSYGRALFRLGL